MSLSTRKELLTHVQERYSQASRDNKGKILDELTATTGYRRKYAINLLNRNKIETTTQKNEKQQHKKIYDEAVQQALLTIWHAANQICSKRLAPFIPDLLAALERFGHLSLPVDVRNRLLKISPATIDRLLETERREGKKGLCTTRSGSLLKKQIKIRTFADWNDIVPGFLEGDLVAHCGDRANGSFLNTLVLTDIASTWTEFFPLLRKSEADVIAALKVAQQLLPFVLLGLDTDNGSEFINYALLDFCKIQEITFTRSRAYKKNDQAHVEEKNGSIIRRLVGYDRYEGLNAYNALSELYAVLRLYVNFFQPSLKLLSKKRDGAKVSKKYDKAKTPYQRILISVHVSEEDKEKLKKQYNDLDPLELLKDLEKLQDNFWKHAWKSDVTNLLTVSDKTSEKIDGVVALPITNITAIIDDLVNDKNNLVKQTIIMASDKPADVQGDFLTAYGRETKSKLTAANNKSQPDIRRHRRTNKPRKQMGIRTWRTRKDPFCDVWNKIRIQLELNPERTAKNLLDDLVTENPDQFNLDLLRTLQRRVAAWRMQQVKINQERNRQNILTQHDSTDTYVSLVAHAIING